MLILLATLATAAPPSEVLRWSQDQGDSQRYHVVLEVVTHAERDGASLIERQERYEYVLTERVVAVDDEWATLVWSMDEVRGQYVDGASGLDFVFSSEVVPEEGLAADMASAMQGLVGAESRYSRDERGQVRQGEAVVVDLFGSGHTALWELPLPDRSVDASTEWGEVGGSDGAHYRVEGYDEAAECWLVGWERSRLPPGGASPTQEQGTLCFSATQGLPLRWESQSEAVVEPLPGLRTQASVHTSITWLAPDAPVPWVLDVASSSTMPVLGARVLGEERWVSPGRMETFISTRKGLATATSGRVVLWDEEGQPRWQARTVRAAILDLAATQTHLVVATDREHLTMPVLQAFDLEDGSPAWVVELDQPATDLGATATEVLVGMEDGRVGLADAQGVRWPAQPPLSTSAWSLVVGEGTWVALGEDELAIHSESGWSSPVSGDFTAVATSGGRVFAGQGQRIVELDPATGELLEEVGALTGMPSWVSIRGLVHVPGRLAATDSQGGLYTWKETRKGFRPGPVFREAGTSPLVATPDGTLWWRDWLGWHLRSLPPGAREPHSDTALLADLALSPTQDHVATVDMRGRVTVRDLASGEVLEEHSLGESWDEAASLAWSPVHGLVYAGRGRGGLVDGPVVWGGAADLATSESRVFALGRRALSAWEELDGSWTQRWSASGEACAMAAAGPVVATQHRGQLLLHSASSGEVGTSIDGLARFYCDLSLSAGGRRVAAIAEPDHRAVVFDTVTGQPVLRVALPNDGFESRFEQLALSPDGTRLAGSFSGDLYLWEVEEPALGPGGTPRPSAHLDAEGLSVADLRFSADGRWLIALPHAGLAVRAWDLSTLNGQTE